MCSNSCKFLWLTDTSERNCNEKTKIRIFGFEKKTWDRFSFFNDNFWSSEPILKFLVDSESAWKNQLIEYISEKKNV